MIKDISVNQANMEQAIMKIVSEYVDADKVTHEEVSDSLRYLNFIWNLEVLGDEGASLS